VAYRLQRLTPGLAVTVLEAQGAAGGNIRTEDHGGFRVECGPNGFLDSKPFLPQLCRDLDLSHRLIAASEGARKNRYVYVRDRLQKLPSGLAGLLTTPLLSLRGKLRLFSEPFRARSVDTKDESVADFVARRVGKETADLFADALVTGIHGGDPALLSVAAAFPRLPVMEREAGSIIRGFMRAAKEKKRAAKERGEPKPGPQRMWSFPEGLRSLVAGLTDHLDRPVRTGARVRSISASASVAPWVVEGDGRDTWSADAVVLACPAYEQAGIVADLDPELANEMAGIRYNRIAVVALGYRESDCPRNHDGFGYIAPQNTRRDVLGVQWCSSIFPDRAPPGFVLWRALCGGVHRGEMVVWDDTKLIRAVHKEMKLASDVRGDPIFAQVVRWPAAIPQYEIGHLERVARIEAAAAKHPGLFLTGNAYRGVALSDCAEHGERVAKLVHEYLMEANPSDGAI
jgi:protoporphyrinogen/coproporphyrinogen III oxidase